MIELLKNDYNIIRKLDNGGMSDIYLAIDKATGGKCVVKILDSNSRNDITKQKRFSHEMRLLKKISSPYVVKMFNGEMSESNSYIAMEYIDGVTLKNYVRSRSRLTVDETVEFAKQMALGFDEIHSNGIVHRDIKSQNIMVSDNGQIKIIDFGIAVDKDSEALTKTDMLIGSPQYVSPELIEQEEPTIQSDIYALGILVYEMLAGEVPFGGKDSIEILRKHQSKQVPKIADQFENVPIALENIITKATAKEKDKRYKKMYDMYLDLKTCLAQNRTNEKRISLDGKEKMSFTKIVNSKWTIISAIIVLIVLLTILITLFVVNKI